MSDPAEPSAEQCSANTLVDAGGRQGTACWYPSMGGYVGKAIAVADEVGCADVWVWHDGEFPFPGLGKLDVGAHSPVRVHYCDPGDLIRFGEFMERLASAPTLLLFSSGLLSKWGFDGGGAPDTWLDWCDEQGIDYSALRPWRDGILPVLVRRFLLPKIDQDVKLVDISTSHNPIRAETVDGVDVTGCWYTSAESGPVLTPEWAGVTMEQILEVAREGQVTP